ncbi:DUF4381 domain-containing protein [Alteromonas sp. D210916BOD_24]|uniref:DUF4381 domain-containing protein n=1 Tax=Alteromonas sp. D210916BOD_24 TaxID=3157618 RepID=UPI00399CA382
MQTQGLPSLGNSTQQDPLAQLRDIHVPEAVSIWPLDWGWWCLAIVVLIVVVWSYRTIRHYVRFNKPRKQALAQLTGISVDQKDWPVAINTLVKRTALSYFPHQDVAHLHAEAWVSFLSSRLKKDIDQVEKGLRLLQHNTYRPTPNRDDFAQCMHSVQLWLKKAQFPKHYDAKSAVPSSGSTPSSSKHQEQREITHA